MTSVTAASPRHAALMRDMMSDHPRGTGTAMRPNTARSSALFTLATELPAAILARMLGIHIKVAVQWQQAASGDWASYAADVGRRNR